MSLVGMKMTGFKYESRSGYDFDDFMENLVGKTGKIINEWDKSLIVAFDGNIIAQYPKDEALKYIFKISDDYLTSDLDWNKVEEDMKKEIFKVGDRVYDIVWGWGVVTADMGINNIEVKFDTNIYQTFKKDGRCAESSKPTLSFTEYTLQGFTQERPVELPKAGELCVARDEEGDEWELCYFISYKSDAVRYKFETSFGCYNQIKRIKILD